MSFSNVTVEQLFSLWQSGSSLATLSTTYGLSQQTIAVSLLALAGAGVFIPKNILTLVAAAPGGVWPAQPYQS